MIICLFFVLQGPSLNHQKFSLTKPSTGNYSKAGWTLSPPHQPNGSCVTELRITGGAPAHSTHDAITWAPQLPLSGWGSISLEDTPTETGVSRLIIRIILTLFGRGGRERGGGSSVVASFPSPSPLPFRLASLPVWLASGGGGGGSVGVGAVSSPPSLSNSPLPVRLASISTFFALFPTNITNLVLGYIKRCFNEAQQGRHSFPWLPLRG